MIVYKVPVSIVINGVIEVHDASNEMAAGMKVAHTTLQDIFNDIIISNANIDINHDHIVGEERTTSMGDTGEEYNAFDES